MDKYNLKHIAGYSSELTIWRIVCDIIDQIEVPTYLDVADILIVNDVVTPSGDLKPSSESECVWSIGAIVNYLSSGRMPFGGRGIEYQSQHPGTPLPVLRPEHRHLQHLVHQCLNVDDKSRPDLKTLLSMATSGRDECSKRSSARTEAKDRQGRDVAVDSSTYWPEKF